MRTSRATTDEDDGPFRKVVGTKDVHWSKPFPQDVVFELLECGHLGRRVHRWGKPGTRRRCWPCRNLNQG